MKKSNSLLLVFATGIFLTLLDTTIMNVSLPFIVTGLKTSLSKVSWALNIYTIIFASISIPITQLSRKFDDQKLYMFGLIVFLIGSFGAFSSGSIWALVSWRGIQAIGAATLFPLGMSMALSGKYVNASRPKILTMIGIMQGLGSALGPSIGGIITNYFNWKWIFLINVPIVIIMMIVSLKSFKFSKVEKNDIKIDYIGSILLIISLFSLLLYLIKFNDWNWYSLKEIISISIFIVTFSIFAFYESKVKNPIINKDVFKYKTFNFGIIILFLSYIFLISNSILMPTYLTKILNKSALESGLLVSITSFAIFIFAPIAGNLALKVKIKTITLLGMFIMSIALWLIYKLNMNNMMLFTLSSLLLGAGFGLVIGPNSILVSNKMKGDVLYNSQSIAGVIREVAIALSISIIISFLSSNIVYEKNVSKVDAHVLVKKIDNLSTQDKNDIIKEVDKKIDNENNSKSATKSYISKEKYNSILNDQYKKNNVSKLPKEFQEKVKNKIKILTTKKIEKTNKDINSTIKKISSNVNSNVSKAFKVIYRYVAITELICVVILLFLWKNPELE